MRRWLIGVVILLPAASCIPTPACTVFYAADGEVMLGGNNEDWHIPLTKVWFVPAKDGKHGVAYVTFSNHLAIQGGMNDRGLFFDFLAVAPLDIEPTPDKLRWGTHPLRKIMEECATVDEAVGLLETHNRAFMRRVMIFLGDGAGNSAIVEGEAVIRKQGAFQVSTNFRQSLTPPEKATGPRYSKAAQMLSEADEFTVDLFRQVCDAVHQEGKNRTLYSTIYDTKRKVIYLYHYYNYENVVVFDLAEELAKGERILDMPDLFPPNPAYEQYRKKVGEETEAR